MMKWGRGSSSLFWDIISYFLCRLPLRSNVDPHFGRCIGNLIGMNERILEKKVITSSNTCISFHYSL